VWRDTSRDDGGPGTLPTRSGIPGEIARLTTPGNTEGSSAKGVTESRTG
jgi:hypothetical protein